MERILPAFFPPDRSAAIHRVFPLRKSAPDFHPGRFCIFASNIYAICLAALILTPGPMVLAVTQERIYWPLAAAGLALMMAAIRVL